MIDFRYHLVSIIAIFLALGLGIVVGSTALQPTVVGTLDTTSSIQKQRIEKLLATNAQQDHELTSDKQFAQAAEPELLRQLLPAQRVVIVEAPGASSQVTSGIIHAVQDAGGVISGQVQLHATFLNSISGTQSQLQQLAQQFAPPGLVLGSGSALSQASQVLASALLTKDGPGQPVAGQRDVAATEALNGFGAEGFLTVSGHPAARATLAVVITPATSPPPGHAGSTPIASQSLVTVAQQLSLASRGTVLAGSVAGSVAGSAIGVMRSGGTGPHLSTVDDADTVIGQIVVAMALAGQLRGVSGNYGIDQGATGVGPTPVPTAVPGPSQSATPSASPSPRPARSGKKK